MNKSSLTNFAAILLVAVLFTVPALAAKKSPNPPPPPPPADAVYSWSGFYVGGVIGGEWGSSDSTTSVAANPPGGEFAPPILAAFTANGNQSIKPAGFTGGAEAGYNWQIYNYLVGVEGDIEALHLRGSATTGPVVQPLVAPATFTISSSASTNWLATLRGRLGVTAGNWLFFATGGAAFTTLRANFTFSETFYGAAPTFGSLSSAKTGYAVGGGIEGAFWQHWSAKAEYLYVQFGTATTSSSYGPPVLVFPLPFNHSADLKANIVRAGLNYHF
jgi:outer membrane immunogenic protein